MHACSPPRQIPESNIDQGLDSTEVISSLMNVHLHYLIDFSTLTLPFKFAN